MTGIPKGERLLIEPNITPIPPIYMNYIKEERKKNSCKNCGVYMGTNLLKCIPINHEIIGGEVANFIIKCNVSNL